MKERTERDNETLVEFWNGAFAMTDEEKEEYRKAGDCGPEELAPCEKLFNAACGLGKCKKVLDLGCGNGWASIAAALSGCEDVTAADAAENAAIAAGYVAGLFGARQRVHPVCGAGDWLRTVPDGTYDGFICSNVLDVVPPETADELLREAARVLAPGAEAVIGLNYYLSPETAAAKGMELVDSRMLYVDGVLRLVSRTDEEWAELFAPYFTPDSLDHFAWPGEQEERRRLFRLRKRRN